MTIKQKQCLLAYLGYYVGNIDGIWGSGSKISANAFEEDYGVEANDKNLLAAVNGTLKPVEKAQNGDFWDSIKYFQKSEFKCKCGGKHCNGYPEEPSEKLVKVADRTREHFGKPITVSSGVRCAKHNEKVGGVANSRHRYGKAMDFCVSGMPASIVLAYVQSQKEIRYAYAIDNTYVHMDVE
jgi:hypothetical protein